MTNNDKLVAALRYCISTPNGVINCKGCPFFGSGIDCQNKLHADAAAAIEALQADIKRLKEANDELREAQTYIDHYGDRWLTSAKDVPTAAYEHGYADGRDEAMAKMEVQE